MRPLSAPPHTGTTHFITLRLADPLDDLLVRYIDVLRQAMRDTLNHHPLRIDAMVVLPNQIHALWTLPAGDHNLPGRIGMLKSKFSRAMKPPTHRTFKQIQKGQKGIWQMRNYQHQITDTADFTRHRDVIHLSPVHAGLCATPTDWLHSSIHRDQDRPLPLPLPKKSKNKRLITQNSVVAPPLQA